MSRALVFLLVMGLVGGPLLVAPAASAAHACMEDMPCYPHVEPLLYEILCPFAFAQKYLAPCR